MDPQSPEQRNRFGSGPRRVAAIVLRVGRWIVLGSVVGLLAGGASAAFLRALDWATDTRIDHPNLLFGLPVAGLVVGWAYDRLGGRADRGNNLILDEIHEPTAWVPRRMAPLVFVATVLTHLFGGSAGREGTAIQMAGSLTDGVSRLVRLDADERRLLLVAAMAAGFGSVFGVPLAGFVFGLEVQALRRFRVEALVPALVGSLVGDRVVRALGVHHTPTPTIATVDLTPALLGKVLVAGVAFGLVALVFADLTHALKRLFARTIRWAPVRPVVGGLLVIALTGVVGTRDYLGLSVPLITRSLAGGVGIVGAAFLLKLVFTSLTLGSGFQGGEVTPLFVIGATLGAALGRALDAPVPLFAALGFVAVFGAAANTPVACTIMGLELFGVAPLVPLALACALAYVCSPHRSIYGSQRVDGPEGRTTMAQRAEARRARRGRR